MRILRQLAVRVADQHQVVAFRQQLVGQLHRRHAFRAVARAGEGDQQRRPLRSEILPRVGDDIGGAVGRHVAAGSFAQPGRQGAAGERRAAGAAQHDLQPRIGQQRRQERLPLRLLILQLPVQRRPQIRLLPNLCGGVRALRCFSQSAS